MSKHQTQYLSRQHVCDECQEIVEERNPENGLGVVVNGEEHVIATGHKKCMDTLVERITS